MSHIARFIHTTAGVQWHCSCGKYGRDWYPDDETGAGKDHARKAFEIHAGYSPENRIDVTLARLFPDDEPVKVRIAE